MACIKKRRRKYNKIKYSTIQITIQRNKIERYLLAVSVGVVEDGDQLSMTLALLPPLHHVHARERRGHPDLAILLARADARSLYLSLKRGGSRLAVR